MTFFEAKLTCHTGNAKAFENQVVMFKGARCAATLHQTCTFAAKVLGDESARMGLLEP